MMEQNNLKGSSISYELVKREESKNKQGDEDCQTLSRL